MKICILAMFGLLALANSAKISKSYGIHPYMTCEGCETFVECFFKCPRISYPGINRHDNTKEKREANPQPTKEADSYGEPRRAYAYADPGYEQPAYRFQNTKDKREANQGKEEHVYELPSGQGSSKHPKKPYADPGYEQPAYRFQKTKYGAGPAKRSAPDSSSDPYSQDPYYSSEDLTPTEHRQVGILRPAKRSAPDASDYPSRIDRSMRSKNLESSMPSSSDPYSQDPYYSSDDLNAYLPTEHRQVGILRPAKRSAPDASDYGVGYGDIWDMATPAVYEDPMKYDDGPQRRYKKMPKRSTASYAQPNDPYAQYYEQAPTSRPGPRRPPPVLR